MEISDLTQRENEIISYMKNGADDNEIAKILGVNPHTVNAHVESILRKLQVNNRIQLALKLGIWEKK